MRGCGWRSLAHTPICAPPRTPSPSGREQEVAAVGSSLAGFFGVFHRLLAARLREAATANEKQLAALSEQLKVCVYVCVVGVRR